MKKESSNDLVDEREPKSKAQLKREAEAAQVLGMKLIELSVSQINEHQ